MTRDRIDSTADRIFGPASSKEKSRWVAYWQDGKSRYQYYLEQLQRILLTDFSRSRILDLGCGAGGLDSLLEGKCRLYAGIDYKIHVLRFTDPAPRSVFAQANGIRLPFPDSSFDYIFALDVLEHLSEGLEWQEQFMKEIRRVLTPLGTALVSTPNFWYPYDAHSRTCCPQFLPAPLADIYIRKLNPEFIKEHQSFRNIRLLRPGKLKKIISKAGLKTLHDLPCCLDRDEYLRLRPLRGLLSYAGLGWLLHAEFWMLLTREEDREQVRIKLKKNLHFKVEPGDLEHGLSFGAEINFSNGDFYHQLGKGWHWPEKDGDDFRWIERRAVCYLEGGENCATLQLRGHSPIETRLYVYCENQLLGIHQAGENEVFELQYPLSLSFSERHLFTIKIRSTEEVVKDSVADSRELSVQIFSIGVTE